MLALEQTDEPAPLLRRIEELEREKSNIEDCLNRLNDEGFTNQGGGGKKIRCKKMLGALAEDMASLDHEHLKDFLRSRIGRLALNPVTRISEILSRIQSG